MHKCMWLQVLPIILMHNLVSLIFLADSSDNSDLEDDIILSLNEWGAITTWKEEMIGGQETESDEFRIPSLPFLTRAVCQGPACPAFRRLWFRVSLESEGHSKITTTKKATGIRPYSASPTSPKMDISFLKGKKTKTKTCLWGYFTIYFLCITFFKEQEIVFYKT